MIKQIIVPEHDDPYKWDDFVRECIDASYKQMEGREVFWSRETAKSLSVYLTVGKVLSFDGEYYEVEITQGDEVGTVRKIHKTLCLPFTGEK